MLTSNYTIACAVLGVPRVARVAAVTAALLATGCSNPAAPTPSYTCYTQPRAYALPNGQVSNEVDTYRSTNPCPAVPIR